MANMQDDLNNPRYNLNGAFLLSKWLRENTEQPAPQFKEGDKVVFTLVTEIEKVGQDCDGTTFSIKYSDWTKAIALLQFTNEGLELGAKLESELK